MRERKPAPRCAQRDIKGKELLWIDYDTAFSLHPVVTSNPRERRLTGRIRRRAYRLNCPPAPTIVISTNFEPL